MNDGLVNDIKQKIQNVRNSKKNVNSANDEVDIVINRDVLNNYKKSNFNF